MAITVNWHPIRSPRQLYKIAEITKPDSTGIDQPILVKIKESVGDWLGLTPVAYNDPMFTGTFGGTGLNAGATYRARLGGFRHASYKLVAKTQFTLTEMVRLADGSYTTAPISVRTISIGFPKGHSVTEVVAWVMSKAVSDQISSIVTPAGTGVAVGGSIT